MKISMPKMFLWIVISTTFLIFLASAGYFSNGAKDPSGGGDEYKEIVAQICLPNKTLSYEDVEADLSKQPVVVVNHPLKEIDTRTIDTARKVTFSIKPTDIDVDGVGFGQINVYGDGRWSDSVEYAYLLGDTDLNQPVFETLLAAKREVVAIDVNVFSNKNGNEAKKKYWFVPPKIIFEARFTDWLDPIQGEVSDQVDEIGPKTGWLLTHPKKIPIYKPNADGPKIRYRLSTNRDYWDSNIFWQRTYTALFYKYKDKLSPEENNKFTFIRKKEETILPSCN